MGETSDSIEFLAITLMVVVTSVGGYLSMRPLLIVASAFGWVIWGVFCYQHSESTWDIFYALFIFGSLMATLLVLEGALLRERRGESIDDANPDAGDGRESAEDAEIDEIRRRMRARSIRSRADRRYRDLLRRARGEK